MSEGESYMNQVCIVDGRNKISVSRSKSVIKSEVVTINKSLQYLKHKLLSASAK